MNQEIREAIVRVYDERVSSTPRGIVLLVQQKTKYDTNAILRTVHLMQDAGELVLDGIEPDSLRLSKKLHDSQRPFIEQMLEYVATHWLAIVAVIISLFALFKE